MCFQINMTQCHMPTRQSWKTRRHSTRVCALLCCAGWRWCNFLFLYIQNMLWTLVLSNWVLALIQEIFFSFSAILILPLVEQFWPIAFSSYSVLCLAPYFCLCFSQLCHQSLISDQRVKSDDLSQESCDLWAALPIISSKTLEDLAWAVGFISIHWTMTIMPTTQSWKNETLSTEGSH